MYLLAVSPVLGTLCRIGKVISMITLFTNVNTSTTVSNDFNVDTNHFIKLGKNAGTLIVLFGVVFLKNLFISSFIMTKVHRYIGF